jgi:hypothetical protein
MLTRAAVAIVVIATLLLPYGACRPAARASRHECCGHPSVPSASVKANCCIVRGEVPAVVVESATVNLSAITLARIPFPSAPAIIFTPAFAVAVADTSPPSGKSVLRI